MLFSSLVELFLSGYVWVWFLCGSSPSHGSAFFCFRVCGFGGFCGGWGGGGVAVLGFCHLFWISGTLFFWGFLWTLRNLESVCLCWWIYFFLRGRKRHATVVWFDLFSDDGDGHGNGHTWREVGEEVYQCQLRGCVMCFCGMCRYYSMYGHVAKLAEEILKGANSVEGVEATLWQVQNPFLLLPSFPFCTFQFQAWIFCAG